MSETKPELKKVKLFLILLILLSVVVSLLLLSKGHKWNDFALYVQQAQSIIDHDTQKVLDQNRFCQDNSSATTGPYLYPWGFPVLLSGVYALVGFNLYAFKVFMILIFACSLCVIYYLFQRKLGKYYALLLTMLFAFNQEFLAFNDAVVSDVPYVLFSLIAILWIQKVIVEERYFYNAIISYVLVGLAIFYAYFVRTNGIVLVPVLLICQTIGFYKAKKSGKGIEANLMIMALPYLVFIGLILFFQQILPEGSGSHLDHLTLVNPGTIIHNLVGYVKLWHRFYPAPLSKVFYIATLPFLFWGIYKNYKRDYLYLLYCAFTIAVFVVWPYQASLRFVFSLIPFYVYFVFRGLMDFEQKLIPKLNFKSHTRSKLIPVFSGLIIVNSLIIIGLRLIDSEPAVIEGPYKKEFIEVIDYLNENTESDALIIFRKPRCITLFTGKPAIREDRSEVLKQHLDGYLIIDELLTDYQIELSQAHPYVRLFTNGRYNIYSLGE